MYKRHKGVELKRTAQGTSHMSPSMQFLPISMHRWFAAPQKLPMCPFPVKITFPKREHCSDFPHHQLALSVLDVHVTELSVWPVAGCILRR